MSQDSNDTPETKTVDRSMNIVVYRIEESSPTIPRSKRDLDNLLSVLSAVDSSIQNAAINDLYRLGKFNSNQT